MAIIGWLAQVPPGLNKSWGLLLMLPSTTLYACHPSAGSSRKGIAPTTACCLGSFPPFFSFSFLPTSHHLPLTPLTSSTHSHEYLKANTGMENMQQGQWRLAKEREREKKKCSFWDPEFPNLRQVMRLQMIGPITEGESYKDREKQRLSATDTDRGRARHWERLIQAIAVQLGRGLGGDWGGPAGTCNWLHAGFVCVCVCFSTDCLCDRECLVCRGPCRLSWSFQQNKTDAFVFSIWGIC